MIYTSINQLIGKTPLVELVQLEKKQHLNATILAKLESFNPFGSVKDRIVKTMIETAERKGELCSDSVIVEPTSGNTGIALAAVSASKRYRLILVMPDSMSMERRNLLRAYGAELVLTEGKKGMKEAIETAHALASKMPHSYMPCQFENATNPLTHYQTTGPEIWEQSRGIVDYLVAGVGTGGTITGVGRYLREKNPNCKLIAVEPATSPVLTKGKSGAHQIQGIGAGFVPPILDKKLLDEIILVQDDAAIKMAQIMAYSEGILVGISSGAAIWAATQIAKRSKNQGKTIVTVLPDSGERYLSTHLFTNNQKGIKL